MRLFKTMLLTGLVLAPFVLAGAEIPPTTYYNGDGSRAGSEFRQQMPTGWTSSSAGGKRTWSAPAVPSTGNFTFSGNDAGLSGAGSMTLGSDANTESVKVGGGGGANLNTYLETTASAGTMSIAGDQSLTINVGAGGAWSSKNFGTDSGSFVGAKFDTGNAISSGVLVQWNNNGTPKASIDGNGVITAGGGSANHAVCWKTGGVLGYCSTTPTNGSCTCN